MWSARNAKYTLVQLSDTIHASWIRRSMFAPLPSLAATELANYTPISEYVLGSFHCVQFLPCIREQRHFVNMDFQAVVAEVHARVGDPCQGELQQAISQHAGRGMGWNGPSPQFARITYDNHRNPYCAPPLTFSWCIINRTPRFHCSPHSRSKFQEPSTILNQSSCLWAGPFRQIRRDR